MAIFGFVVLMLLGLAFVLAGMALSYLGACWGGKEWVAGIPFMIIGGLIVYFTWINAPLTVIIT